MWERAATGVGDPVLLLQGTLFAKSVSPDGKYLVYMDRGVKTRGDISVLPLGGGGKEFSILQTPADEVGAQLSPDGKWLVYLSDDGGTYEVYVQSFNAEGKLGTDRKRISTNGGLSPVWGRNGKELFYVSEDGMMMVVGINLTATEVQITAPPKALFKTRMLAVASSSIYQEFDVTADGQRFLIGTLIGETKSPRPKIILNWHAALKK
jgi:Tol biopolymer transport system component